MRVRNVKNKEEIINNSNYIISDPLNYKGKWQKLFNNSNPIYLEIGMGKGNFIIENAKRYPEINFIGIEKNSSVITYAIKKLSDTLLPNLKLIRFDANKIDSERRLTSNIFLEKYEKIFKNDKLIEIKTDNKDLFEYSLVSLTNNGYLIEDISLDLTKRDDIDNIKTEYEERFILKNNPIYFVRMLKRVNF